jgi:hypothetical protein
VALALWTIATASATVFKIVTSGSEKILKPLFGALKGILVSDRATALMFWAMERRQNLLVASDPKICVVRRARRSHRRCWSSAARLRGHLV